MKFILREPLQHDSIALQRSSDERSHVTSYVTATGNPGSVLPELLRFIDSI